MVALGAVPSWTCRAVGCGVRLVSLLTGRVLASRWQRILPGNLLMASLTEMAAGADAAHPVGSIILFVILAAILKSELLLPAVSILLCDGTAFHLLSCLSGLSVHLLLVFGLLLLELLLVFLLLILHQLLEYVGLLQLLCCDLLLGG